jgi:hypothetical protein
MDTRHARPGLALLVSLKESIYTWYWYDYACSMWRALCLAVLVLIACPLAVSQTTLVSGTVIDSSGQAWIHGSYQFTFQPSPSNPNAQYFLNGVPFNRFQTIPALGPGLLDGAGSFTNVAVPSNTSITPSGSTWSLQVCPLATATNGCFIANLTISGANQTVTSSLVPPPIIVDLTNPPQAPSAYVDAEIIGARVGSSYWNLIDQTQHVCTFPVCVWVSLIAGAGNPGGLTTQVQVNNGGVFGGSPCMTFPNIATGPVDTNCNASFKGPNPYVDATLFGVRAITVTPTTTVSCTSGLPTVTLGVAAPFQNGDGVALYGCGPGTIVAPAAPTVVPSVAAAQTGTLLDVNGPTGSTTYCYQLLARSITGATNVSPETCTVTGPASLGLQTNTITSVALVNATATYLTSAPHGLVVGAHVVITGVSTLIAGANLGNAVSTPFNGWFTVSTVPDNTHFTINLMSDTRNGEVAAGTGGTVNYWNSVHVTATETANNFQYYVYGRVTGGTKTLIGTMWPQNSNFLGDATYLAFDDFGSPVTTFPNPPLYIPTVVPTTPTHDMLATTIVSGAGTTSLVLASNAGNSIGSQTIVLDDAVTFLAAATYAANVGGGTNGPLMLPETGSNAFYPFNSPISLGLGPTSRVTVLQKGSVIVNEPITLNTISWFGQPTSNLSASSFGFQESPALTMGKCSPCLYATNNVYFSYLAIGMLSTNGSVAFMQESGGTPVAGVFDSITFGLSTSTSYSNMGAMFRAGAGFYFTKTLLGSSQNGTLVGTTPGMYFNLVGNVTFDKLNLSGVGIATRVSPQGSFIKADTVYSQGNYEPYFSVVNSGSFLFMDVSDVTFDTTILPLLADYGGEAVNLQIVNGIASSSMITGSSPPGGTPRMTVTMSGTGSNAAQGTPQNVSVAQVNELFPVNDGTFGRVNLGVDIFNRSLSVGPGYSLFSVTAPPPAPTCPVSAGGSVPVFANIQYQFAPIFPNGSEGTGSLVCLATTTLGNQTVTINWSAIPGVTQYSIYRNGNTVSCSPTTGTTFIDTFAVPCGQATPAVAAGGPAGMHAGLLWAQTIQLGILGFSSLGAPPNGTFTFCPDCTIANPCAGGGTGALAKRLNGVWVCN